MKKVLIAHQSTIPHYRVPFYNAVERMRPGWWEFSVVYDESFSRRSQTYVEPVNASLFSFNTEPTYTLSVDVLGRKLMFQTFVRAVRKYDLLVLEDAFNNLSYPIARFLRKRSTLVAYWGHGRDRSVTMPGGLKRAAERVKLTWSRGADGFLAYTEGVRDYLLSSGVSNEKLFVVGNTIDIDAFRRAFLEVAGSRSRIRARNGMQGRRVLVYVGRLNRGKRISFLAQAVAELRLKDPAYHLVLVGAGDDATIKQLREVVGAEGMTYHGLLVGPSELAEVYIQGDVYVFPGIVGLGPLQALCYDLTPVIIESRTHGPEVEYLTESNAIILPHGCTARGYAEAVHRFVDDPETRAVMRRRAWTSISHLTVDNMAQNFVRGINAIFGGADDGDQDRKS